MKKLLSLIITLMIAGCSAIYAQLPSYQLKNLAGQTVDSSTLSNEGKPFIISFFATWCMPCQKEMASVSKVYETWKQETGVKYYAISTDQPQTASKVKPWIESKGFKFDVLLDSNAELARHYGVQSIPYILVFDGKGNLVHKHTGYRDGDENALYEVVKGLVK